MDGSEALVLVWEDRNDVVLVTNEAELQKMERGLPALWPVAFPREDVRGKVLESTQEAAQ